MLKIEKVDWNDKEIAELSSFRIWRQPGRSLLGEGKADVAFFYKNSTKKKSVYGTEDQVLEACRKIIAGKKNPLEAKKMQVEFQDVWQKSHYHGTEESTHAQRDLKKAIELINKSFGKKEDKKLSKDVNKFISDQFYNATPPKLLKFKIQEKGSNIKDFASKVSEKNRSSVYHHFSGERKVSREVALEYAKIFGCDPVDLMFDKKSIPVWGKVNFLKVEELDETYIPGRIFSYVADEKNAERVVVPRDIYQDDIKAIQIESKGSIYNDMIAFYYRATAKDDNCNNKLCVVGVEVPIAPVEFSEDTETHYYFGIYENARGQSNLLNPDPFHKQDNEYILKNFTPTTLAPVVSLINPEVIQDRTDYKKAIPQTALIREEERLHAERARLHAKAAELEKEEKQIVKSAEKGKEFMESYKKLEKQIMDFNIQIRDMQYKIEQQADKKHINLFEQQEELLNKLNPLRKFGRK